MITPPPTVKNIQLWNKRCRKLRALAQRIIDCQVGVIEGSIQMGHYKIWLHASDDPDFNIFAEVYSVSTALPIGEARKHWDPAALKKKDAEINKVEDQYRFKVCEAARRLRDKYQT